MGKLKHNIIFTVFNQKKSEKTFFDAPNLLLDRLAQIPDALKETLPHATGNDNRRKIFVMRHGERTDLIFGKFVPYSFDADGNYIRKDLNMPASFPKRKNVQDWNNDAPLTNVGLFQCRLIGEGMKKSNEKIDVAFCSPVFRCIQTCDAVLKALGLKDSVKICIEPGLMEYAAFYADHMPEFYTTNELVEIGFNIDTEYEPLITIEQYKNTCVNETFQEFYQRNAAVTTRIIENYQGNALISAHGTNLDTNTRLAVGGAIRTTKDLSRVMVNIGFCAVSAIAQDPNDNKKWTFIDPPLCQITHASNSRFDHRIFQMDATTTN